MLHGVQSGSLLGDVLVHFVLFAIVSGTRLNVTVFGTYLNEIRLSCSHINLLLIKMSNLLE